MVLAFSSPDQIRRAADLLSSGDLVAFPTETIYGLGADARDALAVAKIYALKGRPSFNPLIVHVIDRAAAEEIAVFDARARLVADMFWPGPLTIVLPLHPQSGIDPIVTAGLQTVAVRVPSHPVARELLTVFGGPVAAPSANRSGKLSPTTPAHVVASFGADAPFILAAGGSDVGLESTILDLSSDVPVILRPGAITPDDLSRVLDMMPAIAQTSDDDTAPKSPGMLLKHYAPSIPVRLRAVDVMPGEALLAFGPTQFMGIRGGGFARNLPETQIRNLSEEGDLIVAASNLFRMMHDLDQPVHTGIAVMDVPDVGVGIAINDRLRRAANAKS